MNEDEITALHESCHAVVAKALGLNVVKLCAGAAPGCRTRIYIKDVPIEVIATKLALVDLAPLSIDAGSEARADIRNAQARALTIVLRRHGLEDDEDLTPALRAEAGELCEQLRIEADKLVTENWLLIEKVAAALRRKQLGDAEIDALIGNDHAGDQVQRRRRRRT